METSGLDERTNPSAATRSARGVDAVVTYHLNPYASGVVRFNELLAKALGVPFLGLFDEAVPSLNRPLLSFKVSEMSESHRAELRRMLDEGAREYEVYLHDWRGTPLEQRLVCEAARVWCGNHEVEAQISRLNEQTETVWTPGLLMDQRTYQPTQIKVFSFGMAHKIQTARFRRLRELLENSGCSYAVYVSSATHETKSIGDAQALYDEMNEIFPRGLYFMGNLSDVAVFNQLQHATFFASFFPDGVRANNTSIAGAMEHGAVVVTNLDRFSPPEFVHMENVIDIERCEELPLDRLALRRLGLSAMETCAARSWHALSERIRN